jgi:hypothetical protein
MTPELKQDVGPPIATPERRTRAKQNVDWLDDIHLYAESPEYASEFTLHFGTASSVRSRWSSDHS